MDKQSEKRELLEPEHRSPKQKWATRLTYAALVLVAITIGVFLKWSFQTNNIISVKNEPFPVRTIGKTAEANGVIILKVDFCKNVNTQGDLRMSFVSQDREVFLPLAVEKNPKGCRITEVPVIVPSGLPDGDYQVKFKVVYNLNPLKQGVTDEFTSQKFHVGSNLTE